MANSDFVELRQVQYSHEDRQLEGVLAVVPGITIRTIEGKRPAVLVAHTAIGPQDAFITDTISALAREGYAAFALDLYGAGHAVFGDEKQRYTAELKQRRDLIGQRALAALSALQAHESVQSSAVAALGFCLGGQCVMDLLRAAPAGTMRAAISFHGILDRYVPGAADERSGCRIVAFHGYADPFASNDDMVEFAGEMEQRSVDYEVRLLGADVRHAFMRPDKTSEDDRAAGLQFHAVVASRAWASTLRALSDSLSIQG